MTLRSRELVFNKCFHTAGPVWRIKPLSVIFMCSEIYFFFFLSLSKPQYLKYIYLLKMSCWRRWIGTFRWRRDAPGKTQRPRRGQLDDEKPKEIGEKTDWERFSRAELPKENAVVPQDCAVQCKGCNYDLNSTMKMQEITGKGRVRSRNDR